MLQPKLFLNTGRIWPNLYSNPTGISVESTQIPNIEEQSTEPICLVSAQPKLSKARSKKTNGSILTKLEKVETSFILV